MILVRHECRQARVTWLIWALCIAFLLVICVFLFPEMKGEMDDVSDMFSSMGSFSAAFGMDRLNFGDFIGFYSVECGNILGLGGAFYASLAAVGMLAKEEKEHTAEFLLTHPVSRACIVKEKLVAVLLQILSLNVVIFLFSVCSVMMIGEEIPWKELGLLHLAYLFMQLEFTGICFGISAFIHRSGLGIGLGMAAMMYFLNIIGNITEKAEWIKYVTPFGYTDAADIVAEGALDTKLVIVGMMIAVAGVITAFWKYCKKDIV